MHRPPSPLKVEDRCVAIPHLCPTTNDRLQIVVLIQVRPLNRAPQSTCRGEIGSRQSSLRSVSKSQSSKVLILSNHPCPQSEVLFD